MLVFVDGIVFFNVVFFSRCLFAYMGNLRLGGHQGMILESSANDTAQSSLLS
jgi:hypothetical protein